MEIKGTAVKSIDQFVRYKHSERYTEWLNALPIGSKEIFNEPILATNWYPMVEAGVVPTRMIGKMIYGNELKGAWESGRYSADSALTGIYKVFVKVASPSYIINRASKIFSTYYTPSEVVVPSSSSHNVVVQITKFEIPDVIIEARIGGWIERALELSGCTDIKVLITMSLTNGDAYTNYEISWKS